jgi:hypothetical protein
LLVDLQNKNKLKNFKNPFFRVARF